MMPVMKQGSPRMSDDFEPPGSRTDSEHAIEEPVDNGFVKVHDAKARQGSIDSESVANPD